MDDFEVKQFLEKQMVLFYLKTAFGFRTGNSGQ
jgi:hypothetical protein